MLQRCYHGVRETLSFAIVMLCYLHCVYSFVAVLPKNISPRLQCSEENVLLVSSVLDQEAAASTIEYSDVTITVPRHYPGEVKDGTYPSPLHSIHVQSFLTSDEVAKCLKLANDHASATGRFEEPDTERHETYSTCDFAIEDCSTLESYLEEIDYHNRIFTRLSDAYGVNVEDMSYIDCFCANYRARTDENTKTMDRLVEHRDGSLLSYTVLLTPPEDFEGGGTSFDALRDEPPNGPLYPNGVVRPTRAGDTVLHSGKLLHGADVVTSGERTVLVGFVDVAEWCQRPKVLAQACRDFGRMDSALYRHKRQDLMTQGGKRPGWKLRTSRWLPKGNDVSGKSHVSGFVPLFPSVSARADPEYQRRKKLEAEDILLRSILLPENEQRMDELKQVFDGDLTIL